MSKINIERLAKRREGHRAECAKLLSNLPPAMAADGSTNCDTIKRYKDELMLQRDKIVTLDEKIQDEITLDEMNAEIGYCSQWSMRVNEGIILCNKALEQNKESSINIIPKNVKLPTIELPKFSGSCLEWQSFWDLYSSTVHKRTDIGSASKFHYLISQLTGEAAKLMVGFNYTDAEYEEAIRLLQTTYGKKSYAIDAHLNAIFEMKTPGTSSNELSEFRSTYEGHLRGLQSLGKDIQSAGYVFASIISRKIPSTILNNMNREGHKDNWDLDSLRAAIEVEIGHLKAVETADSKPNGSYNKVSRESTILSVSTSEKRNCFLCKAGNHMAFNCTKYVTSNDRRDIVKKNKLCFNCLRYGHFTANCKSKSSCHNCHRKHHTSLCNGKGDYKSYGQVPQSKEEPVNASTPTGQPTMKQSVNVSTAATHKNQGSILPVMLPTAVVTLGNDHTNVLVRALLDLGSQRTFILREVADKLRAKITRKVNMSISGFCSKMDSKTYDVVEFNVITESEVIVTEAVVMSKLPDSVTMTGRSKVVSGLIKEGIKLADPTTDRDCLNISMLIGADQYYKFVYSNKYNDVTLIPSKFGAVLSGPIEGECSMGDPAVESITVLKMSESNTLYEQLDKFWQVDFPTENKVDQIEKFKDYVRYDNNKFIARLPWKEGHPQLPSNYNLCVRRLDSNLSSLRKKPELLTQYHSVIKEQLKSKFIEIVPDEELKIREVHYIPHHCVLKKNSTTPVRVVFDCSARAKKGLPSINDCLYAGPSLLNDIVAILLRFRAFDYACSSDIMKAFLMVQLEEYDKDYTRFLWPENPEDPYSNTITYRFRVVLFGATCSQFLLNLSLKVHLAKYTEEHVRQLEQSLYVDNVLYSSKSESELFKFYQISNRVLKEANFKLRSWITNCEKINDSIPLDIKLKEMEKTKNVEALGLLWNFNSDVLTYKCHFIGEIETVTKRIILSECSKIYDPLGFLLPVTIAARIMMQDIWKEKGGWDDVVSEQIRNKFQILSQDLNLCQSLKFPRSLNVNYVELYCFCDASERAYGAVIYIKTQDSVKLLNAKAKVAPVKTVTLPHLELLAAETAANLLNYVKGSLISLCIVSGIHVWSDSQIVLTWLHTGRSTKSYVTNRVTKIRSLIPEAKWYHVKGSENPADLLTRGIPAAQFLRSELWFEGPTWMKVRSNWPKQVPITPAEDIQYDDVTATCTISKQDSSQGDIENMLRRFSNYSRMLKVLMLVSKFIRKLKSLREKTNVQSCVTSWKNCSIRETESIIISRVQRAHYSNVFNYFENSRQQKPQIVDQLNLFICNGVIKCRGRMKFSELKDSAKFPILLPGDSHLSELLITYYHRITIHGGVNSVLSAIRDRFWIPKGRQKVKSVLRKCVTCKRFQSRTIPSPDTANLPKFRVEKSLPFAVTGVDYAGPLKVREDTTIQQVYICLFTCMSTRAIHLELANDASGEEFLKCFRRFVSRRSCPSLMLSDNALNFKYASDILYKISKLEFVHGNLSNRRVDWKFIPSRAPHMGGVWERMIGMTKQCLRKTIGSTLINSVDLLTLLCEIECEINNRPLTYVSDNIDEEPLTPSHLLHGRKIVNIGLLGSDVEDMNSSLYGERALSQQYLRLSEVLGKFWKQWTEEYLKALRERDRSLLGYKNSLAVGDVVLIVDDTPRSNWKLGKIIELITGSDENVRSVRLKTGKGIITRPVIKLINLEIVSKDDSLSNVEPICNVPLNRNLSTRAAAQRAKIKITSQLQEDDEKI